MRTYPKNDRFHQQAKRLFVIAHNEEAPGTPLTEDDVYVVWFVKVLDNWKAMVSTDKVNGIYCEVTHNGSEKESYVDIYAKTSNHVVSDKTIVEQKRTDDQLNWDYLVLTGKELED